MDKNIKQIGCDYCGAPQTELVRKAVRAGIKAQKELDVNNVVELRKYLQNGECLDPNSEYLAVRAFADGFEMALDFLEKRIRN